MQTLVQAAIFLGARMENLFFFWGMAGVSVALLFTTRIVDPSFGRYASSLTVAPLAALGSGSAAYVLIGASKAPLYSASAAAVVGAVLAVLLLERTVFRTIRK